MKRHEKQIRHRLFEESQCWTSRIEPGFGSELGIPDLLILIQRKLIPVELKRGTVKTVKNALKIYPEIVRPAQVSWHMRFHQSGGKALLVIEDQNEAIWAVPGKLAMIWQTGFDTITQAKLITDPKTDLLEALAL